MINGYELATAWVSEVGICLEDRTYSGKTAIREQWFQKAKIHGPWAITVNHLPCDSSRIYLNNYNFEVCKVIEFTLLDQVDLEQYYSLIEIYKESKRKFDRLKRGYNYGSLR
ncbi:hypothetical protein [Paenibacillus sp. GP183]|uniref:hypothetical protein n=1 Tax=Paenibacillus sp. GP183 TaxID=1882751 RepID=UPI000B84E20C|nr:hypothetical protein [Paenibacillus sp. GP183]